MADGMRMSDRTRQATRRIEAITGASIGEYTEDAVKMAAQLVSDSVGPRSTGALADSIEARQTKNMRFTIRGRAKNEKGKGYTAAVEMGHHKKNGTKVPGKRAIIRAIFGTMKRWQRGEKWRD